MLRLIAIVCFASPLMAAPVPKVKPVLPAQAAVEAWVERGAEVGWIGKKPEGYYAFEPTPDHLIDPVFRVKFEKFDSDLDRLPALNVPYQLAFWECDVRKHWFEAVPDPKNVVGVNISDFSCDADVVLALKRFPNVATLYMMRMTFAKGSLAVLDDLPLLRELCLNASHFTETDFAHVGKCKNLIELDLSLSGAADANMPALKDLKSLRKLDLHGTKIGDAGMEHLQGLTALEHLILWDTPVGDDGAKSLGEIKSLRNLALEGTGITDAGLVHLKKLPALRDLNLPHKIGDAGIEALTECPALKEIAIVKTTLGERGMTAFGKIGMLEKIILHNVWVPEGAFDVLQKKLPKCKIEASYSRQ